VRNGIDDLRNHRMTTAALLVAIGAPKLKQLGIDVPEHDFGCPEHRLYDLLTTDGPDSAHSRYNALIRKLVSYERAVACVKE
jgi:hypothetical protein